MTVGGLTHHVLGQAVNAARFLRTAPAGDEPIRLLQHYERAAWVAASQQGRPDPEQVETENTAPRDPDTIHITWQGWSLATDDFLTTRMMELVVHGDDLASSIGLDTPTYPEDAVTAVLGLLSGVAVRRHGATAVVRALSRPQRAPASVSAF